MFSFEKKKNKRSRAQRIARLQAKINKLERIAKEKELEKRLKEKLQKMRGK